MKNFALITGASAGIGKIFALEVAKTHDIIILARREKLLNELKSEILENHPNREVICLAIDLTKKEQREKLFEATKNLPISFLINNAGFGSMEEFVDNDIQRCTDMITLNCTALVELTRHYSEKMLALENPTLKNQKRIINVSSIASFLPMPYMATYAATKAFVTSFTMGINEESKLKDIDIMTLCPGPTESEFHLVVGLKDKLTHLPPMKAETVVEQALNSSSSLKINGKLNYFLSQLPRLFPRNISSKIVGLVLKGSLKKKIS